MAASKGEGFRGGSITHSDESPQQIKTAFLYEVTAISLGSEPFNQAYGNLYCKVEVVE